MTKTRKEITEQTEKIKEKQIIRTLNIFLLRYFNLVVLLIIILVLGAGIFYIIKPKYQSIAQEIESTDKEKKAEYESLDRYYIKLKRYLLAYNEIKERDRDRVEKMLPKGFEQEELFRELEAIILRKGLLLISLGISSGKVSPSLRRNMPQAGKASEGGLADIGKVKITMEIAGVDYKSFKALLATIESNLRLFDIEQLSFSPDGKTVSLSLNTYYLK